MTSRKKQTPRSPPMSFGCYNDKKTRFFQPQSVNEEKRGGDLFIFKKKTFFLRSFTKIQRAGHDEMRRRKRKKITTRLRPSGGDGYKHLLSGLGYFPLGLLRGFEQKTNSLEKTNVNRSVGCYKLTTR